jgi:hypothetical protein
MNDRVRICFSFPTAPGLGEIALEPRVESSTIVPLYRVGFDKLRSSWHFVWNSKDSEIICCIQSVLFHCLLSFRQSAKMNEVYRIQLGRAAHLGPVWDHLHHLHHNLTDNRIRLLRLKPRVESSTRYIPEIRHKPSLCRFNICCIQSVLFHCLLSFRQSAKMNEVYRIQLGRAARFYRVGFDKLRSSWHFVWNSKDSEIKQIVYNIY